MAMTIQIKRGLAANLPVDAAAGELLWTTDTGELYVGAGIGSSLIKVTANVESNYIPTSEKGVANGVASLDANGLIPTAQLSPLALTDVFTAASETEQLALTAQEGDVCVRTDLSKTYIHNGGTAGDITDWQEMLTPSDAVQSVNGKTGVVSLTTDDITEGTTNLYFTDARADARIQAASIGNLADVDTTTNLPQVDDYLKWDGTNWVNAAPQTVAIDDLTDVDTTTVAPISGQVLKWDGTNWVPADDSSSVASLDDIGDVNVTGVTDGQIITWDAAAGVWQASNLPTGVDGTFTGLTDTPNAYAAGDAGKFLRVNATEDAVEFAVASIGELSDVDTSPAPSDGQILKYDAASGNFILAADNDTTYTAGTNITIDLANNNAIGWAANLDDLGDVDAPSPTAGQILRYVTPLDGGTATWQATDETVYNAGIGIDITNNEISLNAGIDLLTDVDTTTTAPSANDVLTWDGTNWVPAAIDGGTF